jgi:hypothetical protein
MAYPFRSRLLIVLAVAVVVPAATALLLAFPPEAYPYYPRCVFNLVTGLHCPGCGMTRCVGAALRGDWQQAAAYNVLALVVFPVLIVYGLRWSVCWLMGWPTTTRRMPPWAIYTIFGLMLGFWIARNVPAYPFTLLAPHTLEAERT